MYFLGIHNAKIERLNRRARNSEDGESNPPIKVSAEELARIMANPVAGMERYNK